MFKIELLGVKVSKLSKAKNSDNVYVNFALPFGTAPIPLTFAGEVDFKEGQIVDIRADVEPTSWDNKFGLRAVSYGSKLAGAGK